MSLNPDFDFRDMLGGASAKVTDERPMTSRFIDACQAEMLRIAVEWRANPTDVAAAFITSNILLAHRAFGIEKAREVIEHLRIIVDGIEETSEQCEADKRG